MVVAILLKLSIGIEQVSCCKSKKNLGTSKRQSRSKHQPETETPRKRSKPNAKKKRVTKKTAVETSGDDEACPCLICWVPFKNSRMGEMWICCVTCGCWAHVLCTRLDSKAKLICGRFVIVMILTIKLIPII